MSLIRTTTLLLLLTLTLLTRADATPIPNSAVELKLTDGRTARCTVQTAPTRATADVISSKLVATAKIACAGEQEHASGGKTLKCESGQLAAPDEANDVLKSACDDHKGLHEML